MLVMGGHVFVAEVTGTRHDQRQPGSKIEVTAKNPNLLTTTCFEVEPDGYVVVVDGPSKL